MNTFSSRAFFNRFHEFARQRRLFDDQSKVIVAVSGGIDSSTLLDLLVKERDAFGISLVVAHFNHQLRGAESDGDEQLVRHRAAYYGLEFFVERANTAEYARHTKMGIQEAARNLRYDFFEKLLVSSGFGRVATAHTSDDNAETILLNLFRGTGVPGLSGIPVYRADRQVIRPLLSASREEIEEYARQERIPFREDSSNATDHYTRNYVRHHILPMVKSQINPGLLDTLHRTSELFRELDVYIALNARHVLDLVTLSKSGEELHLSLPRLRSTPVLIQQYVMKIAAENFSGKKLDLEQVRAITGLSDGSVGSWVPIAPDVVACREREELVLRKSQPALDFKITVLPNHHYEFDRFRFSSQELSERLLRFEAGGAAEYVDADRIRTPDLILRTWTDGDAFFPLGMKTKKKVSDFFIDAKVPVYEKNNFPILETQEGEIVWVCGQRIDERFKITSTTKRVLKLEFSRMPFQLNAPDQKS